MNSVIAQGLRFRVPVQPISWACFKHRPVGLLPGGIHPSLLQKRVPVHRVQTTVHFRVVFFGQHVVEIWCSIDPKIL